MVGMLDALSLKNTKLGLETLDLMGFPTDHVKLILNRARSRVGISDEEVVAIMGREPDILVPSDRDIPRAVNEGKPILIAKPQSEASQAFRQLAAQLSARRRTTVRATATAKRPAPALRTGGMMDLHERLAPTRPAQQPDGRRADPFAELKNAVHLLVISDLGVAALQRRASTRRRCASACSPTSAATSTQETGLSRVERDQITTDLADDILGHGPLERLLADDTVSEIMVNGPYDIWVERDGQALADDRPVPGRVAPAADPEQDRRPGRPPRRRVLGDGRRAPPRRQPHQRDHPAALAQRRRS